MSGRVKSYIVINILMNLGLGIATLFYSDTFKAPSYQNIEKILPLNVWGILFMLMAFLGFVAWFDRSDRSISITRLTFSMSAAIMATWGIGFLVAYIQGKSLGPTGFIVWLAIAAQNVTIVSTPGIHSLEKYMARSNV